MIYNDFENVPLLQAVLDRVRLEIIEADDSLADYDEDEYDLMVCFAEE